MGGEFTPHGIPFLLTHSCRGSEADRRSVARKPRGQKARFRSSPWPRAGSDAKDQPGGGGLLGRGGRTKAKQEEPAEEEAMGLSNKRMLNTIWPRFINAKNRSPDGSRNDSESCPEAAGCGENSIQEVKGKAEAEATPRLLPLSWSVVLEKKEPFFGKTTFSAAATPQKKERTQGATELLRTFPGGRNSTGSKDGILPT